MRRDTRQKGRVPSPSRSATRSDIIVIGAGAVGAACAAALARAGRRVRILAHPSRGTTLVSGGHLLLQSKRPGPRLELARRSMELLAAFAAGQEEELQYRQRGSLVLAADAAEEGLLREQFTALQEAGLELEWLSGDAARSLEPSLAPAVTAATFCPLDAQVDPALLAGAWLQEALAHGAAVTSGAVVESFVRSAGSICGVIAGGAEFAASAVVIAAGPWSGELAEMAGARIEIRPRRGVLLHAVTERPLATRPLLGADYAPLKHGSETAGVSFSFQQAPDERCILGGSREFVGFSTEGLEPVAEQVRERGLRYLPAVRELEWTECTAGFRPWTPEELPHVGPSGVPGLYLACGHEGDGITLAAVTAEQIVQELAG